MSRAADAASRGWVALSCTPDGAIRRILRDDVGISEASGSVARVADFLDSGSARKAERFISAVAETKCVVGCELIVIARDGARPMSFAGAATDDALLILASTEPSAADLRRENHLYEELSRLNNELINRERELARKSAALERVAAERNRVLAIAAHDLRNPLFVIGSYANLLKIENAVQGEHLLYVEEIAHSARFMSELVEELLDSSRLDSGAVEVDLHDLDLVKAASHAATINRIRAERKEITIRYEPEVEHAMIRADPVKLRQIINNLVVNAIKFSRSGTTVTIRVRRDDGRAIVEVEDQGIGIPRDKLGLIFEPFKTIGSAGTAGEKSTGLGLAIVKQLAELHDARVDVESEPDRGSLFRVVFPLAD